MKKKGLFYKFLRFNVRIFYRKRTFLSEENIPKEPCVVVANHSHAHSPLTSELFFPKDKLIWCEGQLMNKKEASYHVYCEFFPNKKKGTEWFYKILSRMIAPLAVYIFKNADALPVYRDMRIIETYKQSVNALKNGQYVIIFPEDHKKYNEIVNEFHDRFVDVARIYYKNTGKKVKFLPMYDGATLKTCIFGNPIEYDPLIPINEQRGIVTSYLKGEITRLAKTLPPHTVVPFDVIPEKEYNLSKVSDEPKTIYLKDSKYYKKYIKCQNNKKAGKG